MNKKLLELTTARLAGQERIPASPGCLNENGQPLLCLGAAFVASHLHLTKGGHFADAFARDIVRQKSSAGILGAARISGFPESICWFAVKMNDDYADAERRERVLSFLKTM